MREMKDSGISWVGAIPSHWLSKPIGALFQEIKTKNTLGKEKQALQFKMGTIVPKDNFDADIEGTDTFKHRKAGAYGTAIFSKNKFMVIKEQKNTQEEELISYFSDCDVILLEGFKFSDYPKIEIVRKGNSSESVCKKETLLGIVSDVEELKEEYRENKNNELKVIDINDIDSISELLVEYIGRCRIC